MTIELMHIAIQRLLVPLICGLIGCYFMAVVESRDEWNSDEPVRGSFLPNLFGAFVCGFGLVVPDYLGRGMFWSPNEWGKWTAAEPWQWMIWLIPGAMLLLAVTKSVFAAPASYAIVVWPILVSIGMLILWRAIPQGSGWEEKQAIVPVWLVIGLLAVAWNVWAVDTVGINGGSRWSMLIVLAQLGCIALFVFQSYASLGEFTLAGIGIALAGAIVGLCKPSFAKQSCGWQLSPIAIGLCIMGIVSISVCDIYRFTEFPRSLLGLILFLPTIVGIIDLPLRKLNPWGRVTIAAFVSCIIIGTLAYHMLANKPQW
jgi:hypothetical protein